MSEPSELSPGTLLGAYRIVRRIASGGMGSIYEAEHCQLGKRVALKTPSSEAGSSTEGRARFVQEGKTTSRLRHPHVVDITDVGEVEGIAYLVMEYLEGEPLSARIDREAPLPAGAIADILVPVAAALHEAHRMGIIHRDLKPANVFLTLSVQGGVHPKLLDFGISKVLGDAQSPKLTIDHAMLGTPEYSSPEQLQAAHSITAQSDQYSLGVIIYEAATGANPFGNRSSLMSLLKAIDSGDYKKPRVLNPMVDARLERIAVRAMSVAPDARFPSMRELGAELLPIASAETQSAWAKYFGSTFPQRDAASTARPPPVPARVRRKSKSFWIAAALLGVGGTVAGLAAVTEAARRAMSHSQAQGEAFTSPRRGRLPTRASTEAVALVPSPEAIRASTQPSPGAVPGIPDSDSPGSDPPASTLPSPTELPSSKAQSAQVVGPQSSKPAKRSTTTARRPRAVSKKQAAAPRDAPREPAAKADQPSAKTDEPPAKIDEPSAQTDDVNPWAL